MNASSDEISRWTRISRYSSAAQQIERYAQAEKLHVLEMGMDTVAVE